MRQKKGALELSISTIVILVIAVTTLIMVMVLTRNIMCSALGLTGDVNSKVKSELNTIFESSEDEVSCIGAGAAISVVPGEDHNIICVVKAASTAKYEAKLVDY